MTSSALLAHIDKLKQQEAVKPAAAKRSDSIVYWGTAMDKSYLHLLKPCVGSAPVLVRLETPVSLQQVAMYCSNKHCTKVLTSSLRVLELILQWDKRAKPSIANYAGSYFTIPAFDPDNKGLPDIEVVIINPIKQLLTVPYMKFLTTRFVTKLTKPDSWFPATEFPGFDKLSLANEDSCFNLLAKCFLLAVDIETVKTNAAITHISFTGFYFTESGKFKSYTVVLKITDIADVLIMRRFCWDLKAPKVFQNGKYDINYLLRYNCPVYNWLFDTAYMFHSWLSELPKDLGFLNAFMIREARYWKDMAEGADEHTYMHYNALDTWATGNAMIAMLLEAPEYAKVNYIEEFPLEFPCVLAEMTGIKRDPVMLAQARQEEDDRIAALTARLNKILSVPEGKSFNAKSPVQMRALLDMLGCKDIKKADEKSLKKAKFRHPLNALILGIVIDIREARTRIERYLTTGAKAKEFNGGVDGIRGGNRVLFALNPHGTDTTRLASKSHHFWCGFNIQNQPRGPSIKRTYIADDGFYFGEVDLEQAESRDTAYISGDETLIHNVEHSPDFHSANASLFFGVPFDEIFDVVLNKVINKALRQLAKPVNHGANYNMGAQVLIDSMGEEMVLEAKVLLGLPRFWQMIEVADYLLKQFHRTYPGIKEYMYKGIIKEIMSTGYLVHHRPAGEPTLTRRCFGDPTKSKPALNSYIAHPPQSLNAQTLNKAWLRVFRDIAMNPEHASNFKLCAQIHDSILYQWREGHEYLRQMVAERMEIPVRIRSYKAIEAGEEHWQEFTVPAGVKAGKDGKFAKYWSETE